MGSDNAKPDRTAARRRGQARPATLKKDTPWDPIRDIPRDADGEIITDVEAVIADRYAFKLNDDLRRLFDSLRAVTTTDLIPDFENTGKELLDKASDNFRSILKLAKVIKKNVERLRKEVTRFEQHKQFTAVLAHRFGVRSSAPGEWPDLEKVEPLWGLFRDNEPWETINSRLDAVARMPLKRPPGPLPHMTLKKAVGLCRDYWKSLGRAWPSEMPSAVEPGDDVTVLKDLAERFVADALGAVGFPLPVTHLPAAWQN